MIKVAVIGSGVSGLATTWLLNEHSEHEVHLFEAEERPGGHADTVIFARPGVNNAKPVDVDRGFIVFNLNTYPNFASFPRLSGIPWITTKMTFSLSRDRGKFEWAGKNPFAVFCQPKNLFSLRMWRMIRDVGRFNARATADVLADIRGDNDAIGDCSFMQYLEKGGYSKAFINDYILPMTGSIWSTPPNICGLDFPARSQLRFMYNHYLLQVNDQPPWLTIKGGSKQYIQRIISKLPSKQLHLSTPIESVTTASMVLLRTADGVEHEFDHVVMACHSDTSIKILEKGASGVTDLEQQVLGAFGWLDNEVVLHNDLKLMPVRGSAWSCWNFLTSSRLEADGTVKPNADSISVTFDMNQLQHIPESTHGKVLVTLNPPYEPQPETIVDRRPFSHPVFTAKSPWAQANLHRIQNARGITFSGAWTGHGFHEDGFTSGMNVACKYLGAQAPFPIMTPDRAPPAAKFDGR